MNKHTYIVTASILAAAILAGLTKPATAATGQVVDSTGYIVVCPLLSVDPCTAAGDTTNAAADGDGSIGIYGQANGSLATAIGAGAHAESQTDPDPLLESTGSTAVGNNSTAVGSGATALGSWSLADTDHAVAIGLGAGASDQTSADGDVVAGAGPVAIGFESSAQANGAIAMGARAGASGAGSIAIGRGAVASGQGYIQDGILWGGGAIAFGESAMALGNAAIAIGPGAVGYGDGDIVLGNNANAWGNYQVVLGGTATADATSSVAIGSGSYADRPMVVSIGSATFPRQLTNLAAGTEASDAVNVQQLNNGGQAIASWIGGGAQFDATSYFASPMFVLKNPYTAGTYGTVDGALAALDVAVTRASGGGADQNAVHYDNATGDTATLRGTDGTQIRNVAAGTAGTDAANVDQVQEALAMAKTYTDIKSTEAVQQAVSEANAYTAGQVSRLDKRVDYALASATAAAQAAAALAGQDPNNHNRIAAGLGSASGATAWNVTFQHLTDSRRWAWNVGITSGQGSPQVGGGVSLGW